MIMGFMLSIGTGVGLAFLVERFDKTIKTSEQIRRHVQLPALGIIPPIAPHPFPVKRRSDHNALPGDLSMKSAGESILATTPFLTFNGQSPAAEAYRVLRTAVLLPTLRSMPKTILITSGQPGDGKTTTTVNTAISLAELGASVLIIDCDLRTPKVHELLGVDQSPGLSTCLSSDLKVEDAILELQIPNLSLLPSGPVPLNPSELVSSERMKDLLRMLAERYDHILIDSPPLINLADPLILSTKVDGVILVVYGGKTTCDAAVRSREELLGVGANIFGVVLNNFDLRRERYGYY